MRRIAVRLALALVAVSALAWPPTRRWISDVLSVTAHHLDHGPDVPPPADVIERGQRIFAGHVADAMIERGRHANEPRSTNGHKPAI